MKTLIAKFKKRWNRLRLIDWFLATYGSALSVGLPALAGRALGGPIGALTAGIVGYVVVFLGIVWYLGGAHEGTNKECK